LTQTYVPVNISVSEGNLNEIKYNWDGINYSVYDNSLVLMYNLDNRSSLGESNTKVVDIGRYGNNGTVSGAASESTPFGKGFKFSLGSTNQISVSSPLLLILMIIQFCFGLVFHKELMAAGDRYSLKLLQPLKELLQSGLIRALSACIGERIPATLELIV